MSAEPERDRPTPDEEGRPDEPTHRFRFLRRHEPEGREAGELDADAAQAFIRRSTEPREHAAEPRRAKVDPEARSDDAAERVIRAALQVGLEDPSPEPPKRGRFRRHPPGPPSAGDDAAPSSPTDAGSEPREVTTAADDTDLAALRQALRDVEALRQKAQHDSDQLRARVDAEARRRTETEQRAEQLARQLHRTEEQRAQLEQQLRVASEAASGAGDARAALQQQVVDERTRVAEAQSALDEARALAQQRQRQAEQTASDLAAAEERLQVLGRESDARAHELERATRLRVAAEGRMAELEAAVETAAGDRERVSAAVSEQLAETRNDADRLRDQLTEARAETERLQQARADAEAEVKRLRADAARVRDLERARADTQAELDQLRQHAARATDLEHQAQRTAHEHEASEQRLREQLAAARAETERLEQARADAQAELDQVRSKAEHVDALERQVESTLRDRDESVGRMLEQLAKAHEETENTRADLSDAKSELRRLQAQVARAAELEDAVQQVGEREAELAVLTQQLEEARLEAEEQQQARATVEAELAKLRAEAARVAQLEAELTEAEQRRERAVSDLEDQLSEARRHADAQRHARTAVEAELEQLRARAEAELPGPAAEPQSDDPRQLNALEAAVERARADAEEAKRARARAEARASELDAMATLTKRRHDKQLLSLAEELAEARRQLGEETPEPVQLASQTDPGPGQDELAALAAERDAALTERDAAQAKVAELEEALGDVERRLASTSTEPVGSDLSATSDQAIDEPAPPDDAAAPPAAASERHSPRFRWHADPLTGPWVDPLAPPLLEPDPAAPGSDQPGQDEPMTEPGVRGPGTARPPEETAVEQTRERALERPIDAPLGPRNTLAPPPEPDVHSAFSPGSDAIESIDAPLLDAPPAAHESAIDAAADRDAPEVLEPPASPATGGEPDQPAEPDDPEPDEDVPAEETAASPQAEAGVVITAPERPRGYHAGKGVSRVAIGAGALAVVGAVLIGLLIIRGEIMSGLGIPLCVITALCGAVAVRMMSVTNAVSVEGAALQLSYGGSQHTFYLTSPSTQVETHGSPGDKDWEFRLLRRGTDPLVVDAKMVDPEEFLAVVRQWRPEL